MLKKLLTVLTMVLLTSQLAFAQTGAISGQVTDGETGETVPGANVQLVEIERGAATDMDGNYEITNVSAGEYTLNVTFVGYATYSETVTITAGETLNHDVELAAGAVGLDEVVVSGYAATTQRELTGSISSVRSQDIQDVPLQNTESLLQGRAAGVTVTSTSGNPGGAFRVNVRGTGSINAASEPLYIVDGVQISFDQQSGLTSQSPLNNINPNDIESIEVLKDASSAAIYGSQAANGVVLITTKRGAEGATRISARAETGVRSIANNVDYISTDEYIQFFGEGIAYNNGLQPSEIDMDPFRDAAENFFISLYGEPVPGEGLAETDWQDFIFSDGVTQKYNVSASGGDQNTRFYIAGGFEDTEGTAFNTDFTRLNLRSNIDHQVTERLSGTVNLNLARSTQFGVCQDGNFINCPPSQAMFSAPMGFPFLDDGSYNPQASPLFGLGANPALVRDEVDRNVTVTSIIGNMNLNYRATDWLDFTGLVGVDYRNTQDERFDSVIANASDNGSLFYSNRNSQGLTTNLTANARQTFENVHNVSGFVGIEYRRNYSENFNTRGIGFPGEFFNVLSASSTPTTASGVNTEWRLGSYFGNAKYNYDERYFLSVTARYDGHSRFGAETRWGFFPSISGAWRVSEEDFFDVDFFNELKLRLGYGTTGNANIGTGVNRDFVARDLYSAVGSYQGATGLSPTQLANVNLSWEEAVELNLGLDYEVFDGRLSGAIDVYRKENRDLLLERLLPNDSGFTSINENIGAVRNDGIEFSFNSVNVNTQNFIWSTRFNIAFIQNEILELPDGEDIRPDATLTSLQIGEPIGLIQTPRWAGVNPADGRPMWLDADGNLTYTPVDDRDAVKYNDGQEDVSGGFGNTLGYRGFTLDTFFQFSFGQWAFANTDWYFTRTPDFFMNLESQVRDRWMEPGDVTHIPRALTGGAAYPETENFRTQQGTHAFNNASYIRLKNITLSYELPGEFTDRLGLDNVRLFATGINLVTWTSWPWYDPEVAFDASDIYGNITVASYPTERQVNAGIEIQF